MSLSCTVQLEFSAAKRLRDMEGACQKLHGYRHRIEARFATGGSDTNLIADFYEIRKSLSSWIEVHWDHNTILNREDKALGDAISALTRQSIYYTEDDPTAEHLANLLLHKICPELFAATGIRCHSIRLYDTPEHWVEAAV